jgi:hypothetical protein
MDVLLIFSSALLQRALLSPFCRWERPAYSQGRFDRCPIAYTVALGAGVLDHRRNIPSSASRRCIAPDSVCPKFALNRFESF